MQAWLGAKAGLGYSAAVPVMARSFWDAQSTHVLCCVKASGLGVILVCASRVAGTSRLVRPCLMACALARSMHCAC